MIPCTRKRLFVPETAKQLHSIMFPLSCLTVHFRVETLSFPAPNKSNICLTFSLHFATLERRALPDTVEQLEMAVKHYVHCVPSEGLTWCSAFWLKLKLLVRRSAIVVPRSSPQVPPVDLSLFGSQVWFES